MPDPQKLKIGDRVRFVSMPEEWDEPGYVIHKETVDFMKIMIRRTWPSRVRELDENGTPWIYARVRDNDGTYQWNSYGIFEQTGWRRVVKRS